MEEKRKIAAAYIRVSTEEQTEFSPDAQQKALKKFAETNGYILEKANIFKDEGISGRKAEKRPAFMEMIARAKSPDHPFDVILVHKFDRFARNREDSIVYKSLLKRECGVKVISITENIENDKFSIILEAILEAMAEYYSINLSEEVKKGMTEKALRGELQTTPPYGYRVDKNQLILIPEEAENIRRIFALFNAGYLYTEIANELNALGAKTHRGNSFEGRTVKYILNNPVYIGKLRWNPSGKSEKIGVANRIITQGHHVACIDEDTWNIAHKKMSCEKRTSSLSSREKHWLSGLLRCAKCGSPLTFVPPNYFKCSGYLKGRCSYSQHIRADVLTNAILKKIKQDIDSDANIAYKDLSFSKTSAIEKKKKQLEKKKEKLQEAYLNGIDNLKEYAEKKKMLEKEIFLFTAQQDMEKQANSQVIDVHHAFAPSLPNNVLKHAANSILQSCIWDKEKREIQLTYYEQLEK